MKNKSFARIILSLVFVIVSGIVFAQGWTLPKESSQVNWATPERSYDSTFESPVGKKWYSDKTYTVRIPNAFANDAEINHDSKYTFAMANPVPSKGYTTTTFVYGPGDSGTMNVLKSSLVINGDTAVSPSNEYAVYACTIRSSKIQCESLYNLPGGNFSWIINFNSQLTYVLARAKDDSSGNTLILWAIYSEDSRYASKSNAPVKTVEPPEKPAPKVTEITKETNTAFEKGWFGMMLMDSGNVTTRYSLPDWGVSSEEKAVMVVDLLKKGAALKSGVMPGDLLYSINSTRVRSPDEAIALLGKVAAGQSTKLVVCRGKTPITLNVVAGKTPKSMSYSDTGGYLVGFTVFYLWDAMRDLKNISKDIKGIGVGGITQDEDYSLGKKLRLEPDDIIIAVNGSRISDVRRFYDALIACNFKDIKFDLIRNGCIVTTEKYSPR